jgi:hypothetical protein
MMLEFTIGINIAGKRESVTVAAEDALIAVLKVKYERPDAVINYVRRRNRRGDVRHPHGSIAAKAE